MNKAKTYICTNKKRPFWFDFFKKRSKIEFFMEWGVEWWIHSFWIQIGVKEWISLLFFQKELELDFTPKWKEWLTPWRNLISRNFSKSGGKTKIYILLLHSVEIRESYCHTPLEYFFEFTLTLKNFTSNHFQIFSSIALQKLLIWGPWRDFHDPFTKHKMKIRVQ